VSQYVASQCHSVTPYSFPLDRVRHISSASFALGQMQKTYIKFHLNATCVALIAGVGDCGRELGRDARPPPGGRHADRSRILLFRMHSAIQGNYSNCILFFISIFH
jgi:hypothetical protein